MVWVGLAITLLLFGLFWLLYRRNKMNLMTGVVFDTALVALAFTYFLLAVQYPDNPVFEISLILIALAVLFVLLFGVYFLLAFLFLNARLVFKRERRTLQNSLTLLLGAAIVALMLFSALMNDINMPGIVRAVWFAVIASVGFYALHLCTFLTTVILCNFSRPKWNQDYIVVLGSGLVNGAVPPLLAARIDKAMKFAQRQFDKTGKRPFLVMSGGQGADEPRPEAEAMREYALQKGYAPETVLAENASQNTRENMRFSKRLMEEHAGNGEYHCLFATSNYHVMRAGIYARQEGVKIDGIGGKTAWYYLPNALLREYGALLLMHKRRLIVVVSLIFGATLLGYFAIWLLNRLALAGMPT